MADSKRKVFDDPLLYGTFLDSLEPDQVENMFKALGLDEKPLLSMISRTTNALDFMEHQARIPDWFAQAERSMGKVSGQMKFSSKYSKRTVEIYPDWANKKNFIIQRYTGKPINWPLWVGDKVITFTGGKTEVSSELLQAIAEQAGFPTQLAKDYGTRLAHESGGMLLGNLDGYFSKSVRNACAKMMSLFESGPSLQQSLNKLALWLQPMLQADPALGISRGEARRRHGKAHQEQPVLIFGVSLGDSGRVRITLGWPDNFPKNVKHVSIRLEGVEPVAADDVEWIDNNRLEMPTFGITEEHDACGTWNEVSGTLLLNFHPQRTE